MTLILNGTTGISGVDGSAATPAFKGNDSNTGISFGTDIVTINTGGTARVTTDASGNVGIGTSSFLSGERLDVTGATLGTTAGNTSYNSVFYTPDVANTTRLSILDRRLSNGSDHTTSRNLIQRRVDVTDMGYIGFDTTGTSIGWNTTDSVRIDSSGNVGIGTSSPAAGYRLDAAGAAIIGATGTNAKLGLKRSSDGVEQAAISVDGTSLLYNNGTGGHIWQQAGTERMRINSSGNVGIGTTAGTTTVSSGLAINNATAANYPGLEIQTAGVTRLYFNANNAESYITSVSTNPLVISTNGSERMRIGSTGDITIGAGVASNTLRYFDIYNSDTGASAGAIQRLITSNVAGSGNVSVDIVKYKSGNFSINNNETNAAAFTAFGVGASERMRIDSSGNVGIGTVSPAVRLDVGYVAGAVALRVSRDASNRLDFYQGGGVSYIDSSPASAQLAFATVGSERMRIDSNGALLVGTQTRLYSSTVTIGSISASYTLTSVRSGTGSEGHVVFENANGAVGTIFTSGTGTSYNTSSDYRLKENVAPMTGALATVAALKPCTYTWKVDGSSGQGFIAHELQEVVPDCVTGTKDAVDKDGKPQYQGVDTSFLVATVVAALQELKAEVDSLKAQLQGAA